MANRNPNILKQNIIKGWRRRKNLCISCGKDLHDGECDPDYTKVDMRESDLPEKELNQDKRKETIISYRRKKELCIRCGKDIHEGPCEENFVQSDMRTEEEKEKDPRIISIPKKQEDYIEEPEINLDATEETKYIRKFILFDITEGPKGERFDYSDLRYICKKYQDYIVCVIGNLDEMFPYAQVLELRKITNLMQLNCLTDQDIVNHIWSCKYFISFKSRFTIYASYHERNCLEFRKGDNIRNALSRMPSQRRSK